MRCKNSTFFSCIENGGKNGDEITQRRFNAGFSFFPRRRVSKSKSFNLTQERKSGMEKNPIFLNKGEKKGGIKKYQI